MTTLRIRFGDDMPAATVEVIAPDLEVLDRIMMSAGRSRTIDVDSPATFLRVNLPSGQAVTVEDPGNFDRVITLRGLKARGRLTGTEAISGFSAPPFDPGMNPEEFEPEEITTAASVRRYHQVRSTSDPSLGELVEDVSLGPYGTARLQQTSGISIRGAAVGRGREAHWDPNGVTVTPPLSLSVAQTSGERLELRVPGDVRRIWARADVVRDQSSIALSVRLSTAEPAADAIVGYMHRGDLASAEVMAEWVEESRDLLRGKMENPYAACVGAYLLLRLGRFDEMRDWARNLANAFSAIPDGPVIWATQLQRESPASVAEIRTYLLRAVDAGLPVFSEGLRLLMDGLRLLGPDGRHARELVQEKAGAVLWSSPLTASIHAAPDYVRGKVRPVDYDIALAAKA